MTNSIDDLVDADVLFIIGSNTTENHPVIANYIKVARRRKGIKIITVDPRKTWLAERADIWLQLKPGTDVALLNGIMNIIIEEGLEDKKFIKEKTENFAELKETVKKYYLEKVSAITGVDEEKIKEAALMYGKAKKASIIFCMGITQHVTGTDNVFSVASLAMLTGNIGKRGTGVNPLRGQNNVQGACDM